MELNNVTCKKVIVSNETLGNHLRLYSVRPYYHYDENNVRTDIIDGYSYSVICPTLENNFLGVKIPGKQLLFDDSYDHLVQFNNLRVGIYASIFVGGYPENKYAVWDNSIQEGVADSLREYLETA